jgi:hypothetical protein
VINSIRKFIIIGFSSSWLLLLISIDLSGQFYTSIDKYILDNEALPGEKVYLHTDRPEYLQGDTIWFKAYSWFGYDQVPDTLSGVLYVDLLNSSGKVILNKKLLIHDGTSQGDFWLDRSITPGVYILQGYTMWMGNVNAGAPYYQAINVNPSGQSFFVECTPVIIRQPGNDSLKVDIKLFEIDKSGELNNSSNHKLNYSLKIGTLVLDSGQLLAINNREQTLNSNLPAHNDSDAVLTLSIKDESINFTKQFHIPIKEGVDLQFFPEGGRLVNGLQSRVAFKAIGTDGLSREVQGTIQDEDGDTITTFKTLHKGMGAFLLTPHDGKKFFANLWYNNRKYVIPLPPASGEGSVMTVCYDSNYKEPVLSIKQTTTETNSQKYIVGSAYGKIWFSGSFIMTKDSGRLKIPLDLLPEGICQITVLDKSFKPECERLIYIDKNHRFNIEITPDSSSYGKRSRVTLLIKTTGADGLPVHADLSLSVIDMEQESKGIEEKEIVAFKLLESELKGYIEDAGYYFQGDSCRDHEALDLLMLTQGYRKFLADSIKGNIKFQPEREFVVSGSLKIEGGKSRQKRYNYSNLELNLICFSENPYIGQFNPDSSGKFKLILPLLYGKERSILQATTIKKRPFYGEISLDDPHPKPEFKLPLVSEINSMKAHAIESINRLQAAKQTEITKNPEYGMMSGTLPEVTVTARAKNWYLDFESNAEKVIDLDSIDPKGNRYKDLSDLLIKEFGAHLFTRNSLRTVLLPSYKTFGRSITEFFPIYVVDGQTYWNGEDGYLEPLETIQGIQVNDIKKIMVLPPGHVLSVHYASLRFRKAGFYPSLVVIETYSNNTYRGNPSGIQTFFMDGLDSPRQFYSPRYDVPHQENKTYDGRATLYWNSSVRTDTSGHAKVEFFTSDRETGLRATINGVDYFNGNPGYEQIVILPSK